MCNENLYKLRRKNKNFDWYVIKLNKKMCYSYFIIKFNCYIKKLKNGIKCFYLDKFELILKFWKMKFFMCGDISIIWL